MGARNRLDLLITWCSCFLHADYSPRVGCSDKFEGDSLLQTMTNGDL